MKAANLEQHTLRAGMVGLGMIFDDTYRPFFEQAAAAGIYRRDFGLVDVQLAAVATRTGKRAERYQQQAARPRRFVRQFRGARCPAAPARARRRCRLRRDAG